MKLRYFDQCDCGRSMTVILSIDAHQPDGVTVFWCGGCGVVTIHYGSDRESDKYIPRKELIGVK